MFDSTVGQFLKSTAGLLLVGLFAVVVAWRLVLLFFSANFPNLDLDIEIWGASYQMLALVGVVCGLFYSRLWGGWNSVIGRASIAFALGLCGELFGQCISSYYTITGGELPYPSIADLGFFSTIPLYVYGALLLAKAGGARNALRSLENITQGLVVPLFMLLLSFFVFLRGYQFDWSQPLKIFLDLGYPLGDALYISAAILALLLTWRTLGGIMRFPMMGFIVALVMQYISDFTFLYQANQGTFVVGGITDTFYMLAYVFMAASLVQLSITFNAIKTSYPEVKTSGVLSVASAIFNQLASKIITEQSLVIGPLAWSEAGKVPGMSINMQQKAAVIQADDPKAALDKLVAQYERLFGRASHEVCREAAAPLIASLSPDEVPSSLRAV
ncbi:MAG: hypothetical protein RLZZ416_425 [Candidatus Parcubacteria bacterium]|jgi:hypothetical protein